MSRYIAGTEHIPCVGVALATPAVIAHRGAADDAPENTLAAFKLAWQQGADGIEIARARPSAKEILQTLGKTGADGVGCPAHRIVDQAFMQTLRTARKEVHLRTVDDVAMAKRYLQLGADSLTSNRAGWLKQQLCSETGTPGMPDQAP